MRRKENRDYGKILDYDPLWKGPLDIEREQTDFGFLISLGIYGAVWLCVGIFAFSTGQVRGGFIPSGGGGEIIPSGHSANSAITISLGFIVLGIVLSFLYLFLMRHYPRAVVFTAIVIFLIIMFITICVSAYAVAKGQTRGSGATVSLVFSIIFFIAIVAMVIYYRKKIVIACGVVKEATKAVFFFPSSFLFPILPIILYLIVFIFTGATYVYLASHPSAVHKIPPHFYLMHAINIFGLLWSTNFVYAFSQMVLSGAFATWYWTMDKERVPSHTILKFMAVTTKFHLGTLAFGSLIIAIVEAIKMLLKAASKNSRDNGNDIGAAIASCFSCLCGAVENFLEYINSNAYIMCTIHGTSFIQSAKDAFNLLMRNIMNVFVITEVTGVIIALGSLLVVSISVGSTYGYVHNNPNQDIQTAAMVIVGVATLMLSVAIFGVLQIAINTIFLCVLEDYERNDGSSERPYFMPYKLRELLIQDS